ncbi:MAG: type II toxin-antitoxin system prevent-host-death family antitoxin [Elusimicrobiota bacterium]|nr:type II toxin-antitoxin system prevent-host-death family antitoxin [Elusimicrobiota bacterium]
MNTSIQLLRAEHTGVREFRKNLSFYLKKKDSVVVTSRSAPKKVLVPYDDLLEIVEILDELSDEKVVKTIVKAKKSIASGKKGIPVSALFKKLRSVTG